MTQESHAEGSEHLCHAPNISRHYVFGLAISGASLESSIEMVAVSKSELPQIRESVHLFPRTCLFALELCSVVGHSTPVAR